MRVRILESFAAAECHGILGQVVEIKDNLIAPYVKCGLAEEVDDKVPLTHITEYADKPVQPVVRIPAEGKKLPGGDKPHSVPQPPKSKPAKGVKSEEIHQSKE